MEILLLYCRRASAGSAHPAGNEILYYGAHIYAHIDSDVFTTKGLLWRHLECVCVGLWVCVRVGTEFFTAVKAMARSAYNIMVFCSRRR